MFTIRYRTEDGSVTVQELSDWEEAIACWERLLADRKVRIVPDARTGLDIGMPARHRFDSVPGSWFLMVA